MHLQINISDLSLFINNKELISGFSTTIYYGKKIAIIGDNGSGKSSLLKLLASIDHETYREISSSNDLTIAYIAQTISGYECLSGGERFNKELSQAIALYPNLLLLDEPTNHLDVGNRKSLFNLLKHNYITQIIVSHDPELLNMMDIIWHIHDGKVTVYNGNYESYLSVLELSKNKLQNSIAELKQAKLNQHQALMKEQHRAKNSRKQGEKNISQRKWPTITSKTKAMRASNTASKNHAKLNSIRQDIQEQLNDIWIPEEIYYSFKLSGKTHNAAVVTIHDGACGYIGSSFKLIDVNFSLYSGDRLAIIGKNGSGKSTLVKAILKNQKIWLNGEWSVPSRERISYLDQHYNNLPNNLTVFDYISSLSDLAGSEIRDFLNKFLFRKNEEINNKIENLSGGEKVRLSLAGLALNTPELLILDEVTNNIDLTTRNYIINILREYSGAMIVISHDKKFIHELTIDNFYELQE